MAQVRNTTPTLNETFGQNKTHNPPSNHLSSLRRNSYQRTRHGSDYKVCVVVLVGKHNYFVGNCRDVGATMELRQDDNVVTVDKNDIFFDIQIADKHFPLFIRKSPKELKQYLEDILAKKGQTEILMLLKPIKLGKRLTVSSKPPLKKSVEGPVLKQGTALKSLINPTRVSTWLYNLLDTSTKHKKEFDNGMDVVTRHARRGGESVGSVLEDVVRDLRPPRERERPTTREGTRGETKLETPNVGDGGGGGGGEQSTAGYAGTDGSSRLGYSHFNNHNPLGGGRTHVRLESASNVRARDDRARRRREQKIRREQQMEAARTKLARTPQQKVELSGSMFKQFVSF